jgi:hypothetical protein
MTPKQKVACSNQVGRTIQPCSQAAPRLRLENTLDQSRVIKQPISRAHPWLPEIVHFFGQNSRPQGLGSQARLNRQ